MTASGAVATQARVIGALMLRELRVRFGRTKLGYLWAVLQPVGWIVMLSLVFGLIGRLPGFGDNMPLFFATGVLPFLLFQQTTAQLGNADTSKIRRSSRSRLSRSWTLSLRDRSSS